MAQTKIAENMYNKISDKVKKIIDDCQIDKKLSIRDDGTVPYNQRETIKRINYYINSKFLDRDDGIFWNISNKRITHFSKNIDTDTKDYYPYALGEANYFQSWALRKFVKKWFDDNKFYETLNNLSEGLATYGSIVWKKYKEDKNVELEECDLLNLYFDQKAKSISDTDVVELHYMCEEDLIEKEEVWDNLDNLKNKLKDHKEKLEVWEFYGYYEKKKVHTIGYGYGAEEVILFQEDVKEKSDLEDLYVDFHLGRYRGRWMRQGVVERLFDLQVRANQLVNQNAHSTEIASLLLFSTSNPDFTGNLLEDAVNGQIIPDETLKQIGITNTGVSLFVQELSLIEAQADQLCLTPDFISGDTLPSGTPFRSVATLTNAAKSAFKSYRDSVGEKVGQILLKYVFPQQISSWNGKETVLEIMEDDVDVAEYDKALKNKMLINAMISGEIIDENYLMALDEVLKENIKTVGRRVEIPKDFFNFKWAFRINPTGESVDKTQQNDAYFNALQMAASNPALVDLPLFKQYLENNNISWWKLTPSQKAELQQSNTGQTPEMKKPDQLMAQVNS